jgi:hypothetical protein
MLRIYQLEMVFQEYKHTNEVLTAKTNALRGDSSSLGHGRTQGALLSEIEDARREKISAQQGMPHITPFFPPTLPN